MSVAELFEIRECDSVWEAWLTTVNLVDMLEHVQGVQELYNIDEARNKIAKVYSVAEAHSLDKPGTRCTCGLSSAEHEILRRKVLTFFTLQVTNLKHFVC